MFFPNKVNIWEPPSGPPGPPAVGWGGGVQMHQKVWNEVTDRSQSCMNGFSSVRLRSQVLFMDFTILVEKPESGSSRRIWLVVPESGTRTLSGGISLMSVKLNIGASRVSVLHRARAASHSSAPTLVLRRRGRKVVHKKNLDQYS